MSSATTGSLAVTGSVTLTKKTPETLAIVAISGTYGTVTGVLEGSIDGTNWFALPGIQESDGTIVTGTLSPGDNSTFAWKVPCEGLTGVRFRVTAIASGTVAVALNSAAYVGLPFISQNNTGANTSLGAVTATSVTNNGTDTGAEGASTAAAGTTTADAGVLPAGTARSYPTTAADGTKGVRIHATDKVTGRRIFIGNGVSNQILKVYAPSGGTINGAAGDAAYSSGSGKSVLIECLSGSGNTWLAVG